jgi:hypothetical protein
MESYDILVVLLSITLLFSLLIWLFVGEFTEQLKGAGKATAVGSTFAQILNVLRKGKK